MKDINEIKAGKYILTALHWEQILSKPGQPFDFVRHYAGEEVDLNVEDAKRLYAAGAVRLPEEEDAETKVPGSEPAEAPDGGSEPSADDFDVASGGTVKATLAWVAQVEGEDRLNRADQVLAAEQAKGDAARASLVDALEKILDEGDGEGEDSGS